MRVQHTAVIRPAPLRPAVRSQKRAVRDSRALFYSVLLGLILAGYVQNPAGATAMADQARAAVNHTFTLMTPAGFQAALLQLSQ